MRNSSIFVLLAFLAVSSLAIPFREQIALVNGLEVGREEEPMVWACTGCDATNKPLSSVIIEEPVKEVKAILSVYREYTVLAFRYTANMKNIEQDLLWGVQVEFISYYRYKINTLAVAAKCRRKWTKCGILFVMSL